MVSAKGMLWMVFSDHPKVPTTPRNISRDGLKNWRLGPVEPCEACNPFPAQRWQTSEPPRIDTRNGAAT